MPGCHLPWKVLLPSRVSKCQPRDAQELTTKVTEIAQQRGRRGFDRKAVGTRCEPVGGRRLLQSDRTRRTGLLALRREQESEAISKNKAGGEPKLIFQWILDDVCVVQGG